MADHVRKINDILPPLDCTLYESSSGTQVAFNLTGYKARFVMRSSDNTVVADGSTSDSVTILNATAGRVRMSWSSSHLDTPGTFLAEWEAINASTQKLTFPSRGHVAIALLPELAT